MARKDEWYYRKSNSGRVFKQSDSLYHTPCAGDATYSHTIVRDYSIIAVAHARPSVVMRLDSQACELRSYLSFEQIPQYLTPGILGYPQFEHVHCESAMASVYLGEVDVCEHMLG
jgi:hypothetical protein